MTPPYPLANWDKDISMQVTDACNRLDQDSSRLREGPLLTQISQARILGPKFVTYNSRVQAILCEPQTAIVGAAGVGLSDYHSTVNAPKALFVSYYQEIEQVLESCVKLLRNSNPAVDSEGRQRYKQEKFTNGFSAYGHLQFEDQLTANLALELMAVGADDVELANGCLPGLRYSTPHPLNDRE
ncbi:MAG: hypothetical protein KDD60_07215, partial [Bdellovibrionales bacterium]|nr:hypothetical protein [Bdellovibrionales bacterium]